MMEAISKKTSIFPPTEQERDDLNTALFTLRILVPSLSILILSIVVFARAIRVFLRKARRAQSLDGYQPIPSSSSEPAAVLNDAGEDAVTPVVVKRVSPRLTLILSLFSLVALTYFLDGLVFVLRSIIQREWEGSLPRWRGMEYYVIAGLAAAGGTAIRVAWEARKKGRDKVGKRWYLIGSTMWIWGGEVAMLGILASFLKRDVNSKSGHVFPVLHFVVLAVRVLILTILVPFLSFRAFYKTDYVPASSPNPQANGRTYGTFPSKPTVPGGSDPTQPQSQQPPSSGLSNLIPRIKLLFPYLWPAKSVTLQLVALVCLLLLACGRVVNLLVPRELGAVVEDLSAGRAPWVNLGVYIGLRFLQGSGGILTVIQNNLWIPVSQYSDRTMSTMTFDHLLNLSLAYHTKRKTGELLRTLDRGSAINNFFQMLLFQIVPIFVDILLAIVYLAIVFGPLLALVLLVVMIVYVWASVYLTQHRVTLRRMMNDKDRYVRGIHSDALMSWETVKYFTAEQYESNRYLEALKDYQKYEWSVLSSLQTLNLVQNFVISIGLLVGCLIVAARVVNGTRTVGDFVLFVSYLGQLYAPLNSLGTLYRVILTNLVDTDQLMNLLAEEKDKDKPNAQELPVPAKGDIVFDNVSFSYDGKVQALKGVSFRVPAGTSVALVGESGSGKSTILRLLYRFYDIQEGSITVDGYDIRDLTQFSLRRQVGVVPQDAVLFNESIRYNIAYGNQEAGEEGVVQASKAAQIHDRIVTFPDQYETRVGERGVRLSGGEKQRVSIARTILKNPPILLLDEATSALDTNTEREIQHALRDLAKGRTSLAIAHRLSTIINCDLILVIKDGRIAESGSHSELLAQSGLYNQLWQKQIRAELDQVVETRGNEIAPVNKGLNGANGGGDSNGTSTPDVPRGHGHHH